MLQFGLAIEYARLLVGFRTKDLDIFRHLDQNSAS